MLLSRPLCQLGQSGPKFFTESAEETEFIAPAGSEWFKSSFDNRPDIRQHIEQGNTDCLIDRRIAFGRLQGDCRQQPRDRDKRDRR